jgi:peptide/nickel transport system substrate-binding protein
MAPVALDIGYPVTMMQQGFGAGQPCFETLLRTDSKGNLQPWLATSYTVGKDYKSITFTLRKGVTYHDGSDFNAESAQWSLEQYMKAGSEPLWSSVDVLGPYTVRVNLSKWENTVPASFGDWYTDAYMLSENAFKQHGITWMETHPIGTGPFKFESYQRDVSLTFVKNPNYWIKGKPYLDAVDYTFAVDDNTILNMMQTGITNMTSIETGRQLTKYKTMDVNITTGVSGEVSLFGDTADPSSPWANETVREAVEYAIQKDRIASTFGYGYWTAPYQLPPVGTPLYSKDFPQARKYDLTKAKQLLAQAGYPNGFTTTIHVNPSVDQDTALALQNDLAAAGITAKLDYPSAAKFFMFNGPGKWSSNSALLTANSALDVTYRTGLEFLLTTIGASWNKPAALIGLYDKAVSTPELDIPALRAVTDYIYDHALLIPVYEAGTAYVATKNVHATFFTRGMFGAYSLEDFWISK